MRPSSLRMIAVFPGLAVITYLWVVMTIDAGSILAPDFIQNPDALVRLERIRQLMMEGGWFERVLMRVGAQDHLVLHWSRLLDVLIVPFAWLLELFTTAQNALLIAGVVLSLPASWCALVLASRLPTIAGEQRALVLGLGALFASLLPYFSSVFMAPGWPDHHGLMLLVFIVNILLGHAMIETNRVKMAWLFGLSQAIGVWVSPESLVALAALHAGLGLMWVLGLRETVTRQALHSTLGLVLGVALALVLEYGATLPDFALDRLSLFSLLLSAMLTLLWGGLHLLRTRFVAPVSRFVFAGVCAVIAAGGVLVIAPQAIHGPMADADPWFVGMWTATFHDGFNLDITGGLFLCALSLATGLWLMRRNDPAKRALSYLSPALVGFAVLSMTSSMRWMSYAEICALPFILAGFGRVWDLLAARGDGLWMIARAYASVAVVALAGVDIVTAHAPPPTPSDPPSALRLKIGSQMCDLNAAVEKLRTLEREHGPLLILAHANVTPAFLFHTGHRVQAVPIHPDAEAVHDGVKVLISTTQGLPQNINADLLVICPVGHEYTAYQGTPATLHARLNRGEAVPGLSLLFEAGPKDFKIFAIKR